MPRNKTYNNIFNANNYWVQLDDFFTVANETTPRIKNIFHTNNWTTFLTSSSALLDKIYQLSAAIWLNSKGEICYRLSQDGEIHTTTPEKASIVFSNFLSMDIQIGHFVRKFTSKSNSYTSLIFSIPIPFLLLVDGETFDFNQRNEFYRAKNGLIYRNRFKPSYYLHYDTILKKNFPSSIILQYLYYLSNYRQKPFYSILYWLANFFKHFAYKTPVPLIFIGDHNSGIDILFNHIIKPLFGTEYCLSLTEDRLRLKNLSEMLKNKLMYHLDDISDLENNSESKKILQDMILKQKVFFKNNKTFDNEIDIFGQVLITTSKPNIPYLDKEDFVCTVFKTPDNFEEQMFIPENIALDMNNYFTKRSSVITLIENDLNNFAFILRRVTVDFSQYNYTDDRDQLFQNSDNKIQMFNDAIINNDKAYFQAIERVDPKLYDEIMKDFDQNKIKQRNLIKCFEAIYPKDPSLSSRSLMKKLREINSGFFQTKALEIGSGGVKYFQIKSI